MYIHVSINHRHFCWCFQNSDEFLKCIKLNSIEADNDSTSVLIKGSDVDILFCQADYSQGSPVDPPRKPTELLLTVITSPASWQVEQLSFDVGAYFSALTTNNMGRSLVYTPVITSTQEVLCGNLPFTLSLTAKAGVVCVAGQQTKGKGTVCMCALHKVKGIYFPSVPEIRFGVQLSGRL